MTFLGLSDSAGAPLETWQYTGHVVVNGNANPGPTFLSGGVETKADGVRIGMEWLKRLPNGEIGIDQIPPVRCSLGGGIPMRSISERRESNRGTGRPVRMADAHETVFSGRYSKPSTEWAAAHQQVIMQRLQIGFPSMAGNHSPERSGGVTAE